MRSQSLGIIPNSCVIWDGKMIEGKLDTIRENVEFSGIGGLPRKTTTFFPNVYQLFKKKDILSYNGINFYIAEIDFNPETRQQTLKLEEKL